MVVVVRHLEWEGVFNARDLGGLRTVSGGTTRWGAVVRAEALDRLAPAGWAALRRHGVRTVVDLREDDEVAPGAAAPEGVDVVRVPLDDLADEEFWQHCRDNGLSLSTPLYYAPFLRAKAERCVAAVEAVARARPGGVLVHCASGRDRTGLVSLLLLSLAGVEEDEIVADYELSSERLPPLFAALGREDQGPLIREILTKRNTSSRAEIRSVLASFDFETHLRSAGLAHDDLLAVRSRLTAPATD